MVRKPLSLSDAQMHLLREAASGLRVEQRAGFLRDVASHLSGDGEPTDPEILDLLARVGSTHRWAHVEKLQMFDGALGYTRAQGEEA